MSDARNAPVQEGGPAAPLLAVAGIEKSFPGVRALSGVSFEVAPGEVHALLGENGAGKSTLIKIISGVYQPDAGTIHVDGRPLRLDSPDDARRAGIATIYQELLLFRDLTVAENVFMGHAPRSRGGRLDWKAMAAKTEALLAALEIVDLAPSRIVGSLSVGNRQRVEILRALSQDARLLIMDEPTAALTEYDVTRLFDIVRRLKSRGVGIIYISHRMDEIFQLADRVTVLRDGAQVGTRRVAETSSAELVQMMVGRQIESLFPKVAAAVGAPVLEVRDLVRRPMTRSISLTVRAGEILGLAGLVGSGRSELAQTIFGVTPAESGQILVSGAWPRLCPRRPRHPRPGSPHECPREFFPGQPGQSGALRLHRFRGRNAIGRNGGQPLSRQGGFARPGGRPVVRR
jgi:rhamnose transport system ATP-binding protein